MIKKYDPLIIIHLVIIEYISYTCLLTIIVTILKGKEPSMLGWILFVIGMCLHSIIPIMIGLGHYLIKDKYNAKKDVKFYYGIME